MAEEPASVSLIRTKGYRSVMGGGGTRMGSPPKPCQADLSREGYRQVVLNTTATDHQEPHPHPTPPPEGEGILWGFLTFMEGFPIPPLSRGRSALHHAVYHVGCTICPEPYVVQDRVQDKALNLTWFRGGGWGIYVAVVLMQSL